MPQTLPIATMNTNHQEPESYGLVILNPAAGEGNPEKVKEQLQTALGENGYDLYETSEGERIKVQVENWLAAGAYDWVAAIGGDGTVSQVADAVVEQGHDLPLLIIPGGTGNVLARTLELPQETAAAAQLIRQQYATRKLDSLQIGEQHFFLQIGIGLEAVTMEKTSSSQKNKWGMVAYVWTAVKEAFGWQPYRVKLTVDGQTHYVSATELVIANASKIGVGSLEWAEQISPDDGRIDIVVTRARTVGDYLRLIWDLLRGTQRQSPNIQFFTATKSIKLDAERPLPIHGDGESLPFSLPLSIQVVPGSLKVIVPAKK